MVVRDATQLARPNTIPRRAPVSSEGAGCTALLPVRSATEKERRVIDETEPVAVRVETVEGPFTPGSHFDPRRDARPCDNRPVADRFEVCGGQVHVVGRRLEVMATFDGPVDQRKNHVPAVEVQTGWDSVVGWDAEHHLIEGPGQLDPRHGNRDSKDPHRGSIVGPIASNHRHRLPALTCPRHAPSRAGMTPEGSRVHGLVEQREHAELVAFGIRNDRPTFLWAEHPRS